MNIHGDERKIKSFNSTIMKIIHFSCNLRIKTIFIRCSLDKVYRYYVIHYLLIINNWAYCFGLIISNTQQIHSLPPSLRHINIPFCRVHQSTPPNLNNKVPKTAVKESVEPTQSALLTALPSITLQMTAPQGSINMYRLKRHV